MTTAPETPGSTYEPLSQTLLRMFKWLVRAAAWLFGVGIVLAFALAGYDQLDLNGYIHHDRTVDVYMSNDWLVGENRECSLTEYPDANGKPTGRVLGLMCPVEDRKLEPHNVSVTFKGVLDPKGVSGDERSIPDEWTCTRGSDGFTCSPVTPAKPSTP